MILLWSCFRGVIHEMAHGRRVPCDIPDIILENATSDSPASRGCSAKTRSSEDGLLGVGPGRVIFLRNPAPPPPANDGAAGFLVLMLVHCCWYNCRCLVVVHQLMQVPLDDGAKFLRLDETCSGRPGVVHCFVHCCYGLRNHRENLERRRMSTDGSRAHGATRDENGRDSMSKGNGAVRTESRICWLARSFAATSRWAARWRSTIRPEARRSTSTRSWSESRRRIKCTGSSSA